MQESRDLGLDRVFFEGVLRDKLQNDTIEVVKAETICFSAKGLNFLSDLFRVKLEFTVGSEGCKKSKVMSVVVKTDPVAASVAKRIVHEQNYFLTELRILRDVMPRIEMTIGRQVSPKLLFSSENPKLLLMEDLGERGFVMKDRQKGLPLAHCVLAIEQMARSHAGSVAIYEKDPELIRSFKKSIMTADGSGTFGRMMEVSLLKISQAIREWPDAGFARIADKINKLVENMTERVVETYSYGPDDFCVLNHGDCWVNNLMFRENESGEPCDLVMLDFQMSIYTSPAIDLLYFLNTCPEIEIKYDKDDFFLSKYLKTLTRTMESIGCKTKAPTMSKLKDAIYQRRMYALFAGLFLYLRMIAEKEDTEDFDEVLLKLRGDTRMDVFKNPDAVRATRKMLPIMEQRGYFN